MTEQSKVFEESSSKSFNLSLRSRHQKSTKKYPSGTDPDPNPLSKPQSSGGNPPGGCKSAGDKGGEASERGNKNMSFFQQSSPSGKCYNGIDLNTHFGWGPDMQALNNSRGCHKPCSQERVHRCDIVLLKSSGRTMSPITLAMLPNSVLEGLISDFIPVEASPMS